MAFSGPERWVAPHRGRGQLRVLQDQVYDLQSTLAPSDYREAASRLMTRQRRRALVVVLTNLKDEDNAELKPAIATLKKKHLVLVTSLREASLGQLVEQPVADLKDALRFTSALHFLERAVKAGFGDAARAWSDQALDVLHSRNDLQRVLPRPESA